MPCQAGFHKEVISLGRTQKGMLIKLSRCARKVEMVYCYIETLENKA